MNTQIDPLQARGLGPVTIITREERALGVRIVMAKAKLEAYAVTTGLPPYRTFCPTDVEGQPVRRIAEASKPIQQAYGFLQGLRLASICQDADGEFIYLNVG